VKRLAPRDPALRRTLARFAAGVVLIAAMVAGPGVYGWATSGSRVAAGLRDGSERVNIRVLTSFKPQSFHQQQLSRYGVFGGIRGNAIVLFNVSQANLGALANVYWVDAILPATTGG
jgi:hypothetical protein